MWKTTLRSLRAHKVRLVSTALAVVLGVAFMAGTLVLTDTVGRSFDDLLTTANAGVDVAVRGREQVAGDAMSGQRPGLDQDLVAGVAAVDGVAAAEGYVEGYAQIVGSDGEPIGDPGAGAPTFGQSWIGTDALNPWNLAEGAAPAGPDEVVIDRASARTGGLAVGDDVTVLSGAAPRTFRLVGIVSWGAADSPLGASAALFDLATAQDVLQRPGEVSSIEAVAADGVTQDTLAARVRAAVGDDVEVLTGEALTAELRSDVAESLAFFDTFLLAFALIALFVGSFIIYNTFTIVVAQRTRELALLRAIGASRAQVRRSVLIEAVAVGVVASALGLVAGFGLAVVLKGAIAAVGFDLPATGIVIEPASMAVAFATGFAITVVAALLPAWRAASVAPVAALRDVAVDRTGTAVRRVAAGGVVTASGVGLMLLGLFGGGDGAVGLVGLGAAVTFVGVFVLGPVLAVPATAALSWPIRRFRGVPGRLASTNARRNPRRTAGAAVALTIGVSLVGFIAAFAASAKVSIADSIDRNFSGDLVLTSGAFGPEAGFSPDLASGIADVDGVASVAEVRLGSAALDGVGVTYSAVEPVAATEVFDIGVVDGDVTALGTDGLAVHDDLAAEHGWAVGDHIDVAFPRTGVVPLHLVATYERQEIAGTAVVSLATHEANTAAQLDLQAVVRYADGADAVEVRRAVESLAGTYPNVEVQDLTQFKEQQAAQIDQLLAMIYVLLLLAVVIALIGIANTLTLSIHERTRELGLLRAVGLSRSQLRAAIRWESVVVALFGTVLGLVVGLGFGWALVRALASEGFGSFVVPMDALVVITVLAAVAGVVAGLRPAWRAARLDILGAIATE